VPTKTKIPNTNDGNASNYSSLLKNLENIKSEFITLREYVGDSTDGLQEKISVISEMINRTEISSCNPSVLSATYSLRVINSDFIFSRFFSSEE
jgi:predicted translin family RNA/ssDNA-binding protein